MIVNCAQCGAECDRKPGDVIRARKEGRSHFCSKACSSIGAIRRSKMGNAVYELASRECGTNCVEAVSKGFRRISVNEILIGWHRRGIVVRAESHTSGPCAIAYQYFLSQKHKDAWEALPLADRPNAARKRKHFKEPKIRKPKVLKLKPLPSGNRIQLSTWARAPLVGSIHAKKTVVRQQGISLGYDERYQISPEAAAAFEGEFSKLGPGRYVK
jgi:hypothetical protein